MSLHGNPRVEQQLGQWGRMCKPSYKATLVGFIGTIWRNRRSTLFVLNAFLITGNAFPWKVFVLISFRLLIKVYSLSPKKNATFLKDRLLSMGFVFQITRARRQVKAEPPKKGKSGRSGAFSVLVSLMFRLLPIYLLHMMHIYMLCFVLSREIRRTKSRTPEPEEAYRRQKCWKIKCPSPILFIRKGVHSKSALTFYQKHVNKLKIGVKIWHLE